MASTGSTLIWVSSKFWLHCPGMACGASYHLLLPMPPVLPARTEHLLDAKPTDDRSPSCVFMCLAADFKAELEYPPLRVKEKLCSIEIQGTNHGNNGHS